MFQAGVRISGSGSHCATTGNALWGSPGEILPTAAGAAKLLRSKASHASRVRKPCPGVQMDTSNSDESHYIPPPTGCHGCHPANLRPSLLNGLHYGLPRVHGYGRQAFGLRPFQRVRGDGLPHPVNLDLPGPNLVPNETKSLVHQPRDRPWFAACHWADRDRVRLRGRCS